MQLSNYDEWKQCITTLCGIPLTLDYIQQRITELRDSNDYRTQKFKETWGQAHLETVIGWFERAKQDVAK